jgi:hypothetical protein
MTRAKLLALAALSALAACSGTSTRQSVKFSRLSFEMPEDWSHKDTLLRGSATSVWTPDDNVRKESVTVIRTIFAPAVAQAGSPALDSILANAESSLPGAKAMPVAPFLTRSGLPGARIDVEYVPPGQRERYHRVHVVLVDHERSSLIHVLYTARTPDAELSVLDTVLATIREGEG